MRDGFGAYHPIVNMIFFMAVIGTAMFVMHPVLNLISFFGGAVYYIYLTGRRGSRFVFSLVPVFLVTSLINPLFSHKGGTLICYLPSGNPLTLESVLYGLSSGLMITTVILWFASLHIVMTSDKILCFAGGLVPSLGMLLSMVLRFVPKYAHQAKKTLRANKALGLCEGGKYHKIKNEMNVFRIMTTWALENSIITADSMKARGYGARKRTRYSVYRFEKRDGFVLMMTAVLWLLVLWPVVTEIVTCVYYPTFQIDGFQILSQEGNYNHFLTDSLSGRENLRAAEIAAYMAQILLCFLPVIINGKEDMKWRRLRSKI